MMRNRTSVLLVVFFGATFSLWAQQRVSGRGDETRMGTFGAAEGIEFQKPIHLSGYVIMEDGTSPPEPVLITRICDGRRFPEGHTNPKGRFNINLRGDSTLMASDASITESVGDSLGSKPFDALNSAGRGGALGQINLDGCELLAVLPGYTAEPIRLTRRSSFDSPNVGTFVLRQTRGVPSGSISSTSLAAPKKAKKAYAKAFIEMRKPKPNVRNAVKELEKAVSAYPTYAIAWDMLGRIHIIENNLTEARKAFEKAIEADEKYLNPYGVLTRLALSESRWEEAKQLSRSVLTVDPQVTQAQYYHAVASYELGEIEQAVESLTAVQMAADSNNYPSALHLMGLIMVKKGQFTPAATQFRAFLAKAPQSSMAPAVARKLVEWEALGVIEKAALPVSNAAQQNLP